VYGFSEELLMAWRKAIDGGGGTLGSEEPALPFKREEIRAGREEDVVVARWADGHEHAIPGLTYTTLGDLMRGGQSVSQGPLWEGTHAKTMHKITVAQRVDRDLLVSVYEQSRQILQIKASKFGPLADEHRQAPNDNPTIQKAMKFLEPLVLKYCAGELEKEDLKKERDAMLEAMTRDTTSRSKRPAASTMTLGERGMALGRHLVHKRPAMAIGVGLVRKRPATATSEPRTPGKAETDVIDDGTRALESSSPESMPSQPAQRPAKKRNWKLRAPGPVDQHSASTPSRLPPVRDSAMSVWTTGGLFLNVSGGS